METHFTARRTGSRATMAACALVAAALLTPISATAQDNKVGGHFGIVLPLVTDVDGETTDITEDFVIGFPMGITVKKGEKLAFDLEFVPIIDDTPRQSIELLVHPGVLWNLPSATVGLRFATEIDGDAWGFTPLVAKGFPIPGKNASYFVELDFPIRFIDNPAGGNDTAFGIAFHTGIGF